MNSRQNRIVDMVNAKGSISFKELKGIFPDISEMTLRRDLEMLDETKQLVRIHGGARALATLVSVDDLYSRRALTHSEEKAFIAKKAVRFIVPESAFYLDSGSTLTEFAKVLPDEHSLIFTSSLSVALELARLKKPDVTVLGGHLHSSSLSVCGMKTMSFLDDMNLNFAFFGVTGYCKGQGFTCGHEEEYYLKRKVLSKANKSIILMDSSKVGLVSSFTFAGLEDIDVVVSDGKLPPDVTDDFEKAGIEII